MTISREAISSLRSHWAIEALGHERARAAQFAAASMYVDSNLGRQLHREDSYDAATAALIQDVAFAYEIVASESIDALAHPSVHSAASGAEVAEAAAHEAFALLRALPLKRDSLEALVHQVLQLGALAYCSDRWAEFRAWMREREVTPELFVTDGPWDMRVLSDLGQIWARLLRKDGWRDLEGVAQTVSRLRAEQQENEELLFDAQARPEDLQVAGWRLVALYHWARLSEMVATYLMQGEPVDIATQLDFHFDRAISAAQQSADPAFVVVLQWQRAMAQRMVAGALWSVTRIGPEIRSIVETATRQRSMFEMLPPQRIAIQEQGLMDPASAAVVVDLPTSAGKTILAEFKIVQAIGQFKQDNGWVAYVAPTRALVSQITRRLRRDLGPSGIRVEELTSAVEIDEIEAGMLNESPFDVLVATPEKLHLAIRNAAIGRPLALLVLDEAHNIEDSDRGIRIELLLATVKRDCAQANFLLLMPYVPNGDDLARWLAPQTGKSVSLATTPWQPNDRLIGLVSVVAPSSGRGRDWRLSFEPMLTSGSSMNVSGSYQIGQAPQLNCTFSSIKNSLSKIAGASALTLSERGTAIVICPTISTVWTIAEELTGQLPEVEDPDIALVQRYLAAEISEDYALIGMLAHQVGVHHAGLSDETRALMEWLAEQGKLRILVATTGLSQGLNFPVSSILLASRNLPSGKFNRPMTAREFWNLAGRAGRVDQDSIGVVGISSKEGDRESLAQFLSEQTGALVSRLVVLLDELEDAGRLLNLERTLYNDQWADFRSYVAHLFAQKKNLDAVLSETELLLRNTFGYSSLAEASPVERQKGVRLLEATRSYAAELAQNIETATLADSTGFTPEGIRSAMGEMRRMDKSLDASDWQPDSLFGDVSSSALPDLMRVMLQLPQIRGSIDELSGAGTGIGDRAAKIAADWVAGISLKAIAERYFGDAVSPTAALTDATKAIYRNLATAGTWGITALSKLPTSGIDFDNVSESDLRSINLLGAMLYHGVNTEAGVVMRMSSVPRTAANSLGAEFAERHEPGALRPAEAREFLSQLSDADWGRHVPRGSNLAGSDLRDLWLVLSGSNGDPRVRSTVGAAE
ncbi:DEAD/DEAH box helicase [Gordonia sp. TBRC 11910]|uniref:DEAD/DEAH box helicase n=1 Tax=Gordonia asplenii TaxID=2725283 RepID=A0A848KXS2_9ACTN|nr:DEAD/DEAH box helicase [Gordonia asplenii]NMO00258.1 DEAD/DEAH box helicase [Gordonia asplenii]